MSAAIEVIMLKFPSMSRFVNSFLLIALMTGCSEPSSYQPPLVVFLVRHAEKVDASENSKLSAAGNARAAELGRILHDADIEYVHSTDFIRTRKTALPVATKCGVKIGLYDAGDLPRFVGQLKSNGGRHLVVGHSNTTPKLVELLGGEPCLKIQEEEYDRLYIVTIDKDGVASTVLIRFGDAFVHETGEQAIQTKSRRTDVGVCSHGFDKPVGVQWFHEPAADDALFDVQLDFFRSRTADTENFDVVEGRILSQRTKASRGSKSPPNARPISETSIRRHRGSQL